MPGGNETVFVAVLIEIEKSGAPFDAVGVDGESGLRGDVGK